MTTLQDDELGESYILRYLALRAEKRIGAVWLGRAGICWIAPVAAPDQWSARVACSFAKLRQLIDKLDPPQINSDDGALAPPKIPVRSAVAFPLVSKRSA